MECISVLRPASMLMSEEYDELPMVRGYFRGDSAGLEQKPGSRFVVAVHPESERLQAGFRDQKAFVSAAEMGTSPNQ
jgi:hypothetical protein